MNEQELQSLKPVALALLALIGGFVMLMTWPQWALPKIGWPRVRWPWVWRGNYNIAVEGYRAEKSLGSQRLREQAAERQEVIDRLTRERDEAGAKRDQWETWYCEQGKEYADKIKERDEWKELQGIAHNKERMQKELLDLCEKALADERTLSEQRKREASETIDDLIRQRRELEGAEAQHKLDIATLEAENRRLAVLEEDREKQIENNQRTIRQRNAETNNRLLAEAHAKQLRALFGRLLEPIAKGNTDGPIPDDWMVALMVGPLPNIGGRVSVGEIRATQKEVKDGTQS